MKGIKEQIYDLMISENVSQEALAKRLGCSRQNVNSRMKNDDMMLSTAEKILGAVGYRLVIERIDEPGAD